ncbi:MAG: hypothetical protein Fur005_44180 [Roseiflexaceae bacterium]
MVSGSWSNAAATGGNRVSRTRQGITTIYAFGLWEQVGSNARKLYQFHGHTIAQREGSGAITYLHGDHLGSVAVTSDGTGASIQRQFFDPWGRVRSGSTPGVTPNFTGPCPEPAEGSALMTPACCSIMPAITIRCSGGFSRPIGSSLVRPR